MKPVRVYSDFSDKSIAAIKSLNWFLCATGPSIAAGELAQALKVNATAGVSAVVGCVAFNWGLAFVEAESCAAVPVEYPGPDDLMCEMEGVGRSTGLALGSKLFDFDGYRRCRGFAISLSFRGRDTGYSSYCENFM